MKTANKKQDSSLLFPETNIIPRDRTIFLNKEKLIEIIKTASSHNTRDGLRQKIYDLIDQLSSLAKDRDGVLNIGTNGDTLKINEKYLLGELKQIVEAQTLERSKYYLNRLIKGLEEQKTSKLNDINLNRWKEYSDIITDSLWVLHKRDSSGVHTAGYWGNFIPQIPNQMVRRFTKKGELPNLKRLICHN